MLSDLNAPSPLFAAADVARTVRAAMKPWKLIVTTDPDQTLGEGRMRHFAELIDAANAFATTPEPYAQVIYDDGCEVRELNADEQHLLDNVCELLGVEVVQVEG